MPLHAASETARILAPVLRESGFIRRGRNWYRYGGDSILLVNVQQSRLPTVAYVNLGVYYYQYGMVERPKIVDCHVDTRLNSLVSNPLREMELLDLMKDIPSESRRSELRHMVRTYALPWLERMAAIDSARTFLASNPAAAHVAPKAIEDLRAPLVPSTK